MGRHRTVYACSQTSKTGSSGAPKLSGPHAIGHDDFMPQRPQPAADPGRMRPDLQCDSTARHGAEDLLQCLRTGTDLLLQLYLARVIHYAKPTVAIPQIQAAGELLLRKNPARLRGRGANLLHCRSPFYLCFEHVDNLGAYTASRPETGLLISSGNVSHRVIASS